MGEATFTFRVDEALKTEFATAAKVRDRSSAQLLRDFMREYVQQQEDVAAHDAWLRQQRLNDRTVLDARSSRIAKR